MESIPAGIFTACARALGRVGRHFVWCGPCWDQIRKNSSSFYVLVLNSRQRRAGLSWVWMHGCHLFQGCFPLQYNCSTYLGFSLKHCYFSFKVYVQQCPALISWQSCCYKQHSRCSQLSAYLAHFATMMPQWSELWPKRFPKTVALWGITRGPKGSRISLLRMSNLRNLQVRVFFF